MLIDWFTVVAQIINFLILVWLLNRFLYRPILKAIDARDTRITSELEKARALKSEADKQRDDFKKKEEDFANQRAQKISQAKDEAKTEKKKLLDDIRKEVDTVRQKSLAALDAEQSSFQHEILGKAQTEVFAIARKTLSDLASAKLEEKMVEVFIQKCQDLTQVQRDPLQKQTSTVIRTTLSLAKDQQERIEKVVQQVFPSLVEIRFELAPELVSGIELATQNTKLVWSVADYLSSLEHSIKETLIDMRKAKPGESAHGS